MIVDELRHRYRRTPPLSLEGSREVLEEMANPPKDTPERRRMFERVRFMMALRKQLAVEGLAAEDLGGAIAAAPAREHQT